MNAAQLARLASLRHANSHGTVVVVANPERVIASTDVDTIDDAIGMLATAMTALLTERAKAERATDTWLPKAMRACPESGLPSS